MPSLNYHDPVLFANFFAQAVVSVTSARQNRHVATRVREHLTSDKNSHIFQHIHGSETCRALCSENCFSILDTASTSFQGGLKYRVGNPSLNKQVNHVNLTLSFQNFLVFKYPLFFYHCIIVFSSASLSRCYSVFISSIYFSFIWHRLAVHFYSQLMMDVVHPKQVL